jgi:hypothetical protein
MDADRFDALTRSLLKPSATGATRRGVTRLLGQLVTAVLLAPVLAEDETAAKKKRKKKKRAAPGAGPAPLSPPPGCPSGQKPCAGGCIPNAQCCNNADCQVSGQVCDNATRQCACPEALPEICGGACLPPCGISSERKTDCGCCIRNLNPSGNNFLDCCSQLDAPIGDIRFCIGRLPGVNCEFDLQCLTVNCVHGACSACEKTDDYCRKADTCSGGAGKCLRAFADGTIRCGTPLLNFSCDLCRSDLDCDQGQGLGHFCAVATGNGCNPPCPQGQTFCARP